MIEAALSRQEIELDECEALWENPYPVGPTEAESEIMCAALSHKQRIAKLKVLHDARLKPRTLGKVISFQPAPAFLILGAPPAPYTL